MNRSLLPLQQLQGSPADALARAFLFMTRPGEKKIVEMTLRLSDTLKRDLQDIAMLEDR